MTYKKEYIIKNINVKDLICVKSIFWQIIIKLQNSKVLQNQRHFLKLFYNKNFLFSCVKDLIFYKLNVYFGRYKIKLRKIKFIQKQKQLLKFILKQKDLILLRFMIFKVTYNTYIHSTIQHTYSDKIRVFDVITTGFFSEMC